MGLFVRKMELGRARLREEMLRGAIEMALRQLRRAGHATAPIEDCVQPAMKVLSGVLDEVKKI